MDFIDEVRAFAKKCERLIDKLATEEATKHALVLPFLQLLGYNVFDPTEVVPEFTADVGTKKGEKVDYAIMVNGEPAILVETKAYGEDLSAHDSQLYRYFSVTRAKFAILTDGVTYRFYSDLQEPNKMDCQPFLEFCMLDPKEALVPELRRFHRESFNIDELFSAAANLKYTSAIRQRLDALLKDPSDEFLRLLVRDVYTGMLTQKALGQFKPIVKRAITQYVNDTINERLSSAMQQNEVESQSDASEAGTAEMSDEGECSGVITTESELEAFQIIRAILRREFSPHRITYKDTKSYFSVLLDDSTWRWICRLDLDGTRWHITLHAGDGKERRPLNSLDELFSMEAELLDAARRQDRSRMTGAEAQ